jgi:hypothetical protein
MIIFYNKKTGSILGTIAGRVHDQAQMGMTITNKETPAEDVEKYIIGWEQTNELEDFIEEVEEMVEIGDGLFKKVKRKERLKRTKKIEHNLDKFELLQRFEDNTPENPMDYKIENNNFVKIIK